MFTIPLGFRLVFACIAAVAGILAAIFGQALWQNIVYLITQRGRKPNPRPLRLWLAFILSAIATVISGAVVTVVPTLDSPPPTQIAWVYITPVGQFQPSTTEAENNKEPNANCFDTGDAIQDIAWVSTDTLVTAHDSAMRIWRISDGILERTINAKIGWIGDIALSPDGNTIVAAEGTFQRGHLVVYNIQSRRAKYDMNLIDTLDIAFSPDGKTFATGESDGSARIWQLSDGNLLRQLEHPGAGGFLTEVIVAVAFSPDGQVLATGDTYGIIRFWRVSDGELVLTLDNLNSAYDIAFSPNGKILATSTENGPIILWQVSDGEKLNIIEGHLKTAKSLSWSPNGNTLASGGYDNSVRLWNPFTGEQILILKGHTNSVSSVVFSADGKTIASASFDHTVCLWENIPK